ncbi:hypothetical protein I2W78_05545 [Streptomyces spinoverrucosus]|nr:hypothetical protein [Streptomyces spinoverrucosus]MBG0851334.1 hypothetical protein [Streptomyces spinoverrucosus]
MLPADYRGRDVCGRVGGFGELFVALASCALVRDRDRLSGKEAADAAG